MHDFGNKLALNSVRYSKIGAKEWGHGMVFLEHEIMVCGQAERSNADAQHELGALLATGIGTRQSYAEAAYGSNAPPSKAMAARNSGARSPFKATLVRYMPWVRPIATTTW